MILALETGWTPDVLVDLPEGFRQACHWALYGRAIVGPDGLPSTAIPKSAPVEVRQAAMRQSVEVAKLRDVLYPDGD